MDANADTRHRQTAELPETLAASEPAGAIDQPRRSPPLPDDPQPPDHLDDRPAAADGELTAEEDEKAEHGAADLETLAQAPTGPLYSVFSKRMKKHIVFLTAWGGFFSPLSANIYFPALILSPNNSTFRTA